MLLFRNTLVLNIKPPAGTNAWRQVLAGVEACIPAGGDSSGEASAGDLGTCEDLSSVFALKSVHLMIRKVVFWLHPHGVGGNVYNL